MRKTGSASPFTVVALLLGIGLMAAACTKPTEVEVVNGCDQTIEFTHFDKDSFAPEFVDQEFAKIEWITIKPGDSANIDIGLGGPTSDVDFTVIAEGDERVWNPVTAPAEAIDDNPDKGRLHLTGDLCAGAAT